MFNEVLAAGIVTDTPNTLAGTSGLEGILLNLVGFLIPAGAVTLFIMLLIGGIKYITAGANPGNVGQARATITYAIAGIVILAMAYLLLVVIQYFTGANVTDFTLRTF